jgi:hypothetical protein
VSIFVLNSENILLESDLCQCFTFRVHLSYRNF